jgi:hypothetical protein
MITDYHSAMATAEVTLGFAPNMKTEKTEMVIIGGGICGILAAKQCHDRGMKYVVVERESKLGGVWHTMANGTSFLQVSCFIKVQSNNNKTFLINICSLNTRLSSFAAYLEYFLPTCSPALQLFCRLSSLITALMRNIGLTRTLLPKILPLM